MRAASSRHRYANSHYAATVRRGLCGTTRSGLFVRAVSMTSGSPGHPIKARDQAGGHFPGEQSAIECLNIDMDDLPDNGPH